MKRVILVLVGIILLSAFAFGIGIFSAHLKLRYFSPVVKVIKPVTKEIRNIEEKLTDNISRNDQNINIETPPVDQSTTATLEEKKVEESFSFGIIGDTQYFGSNNSGISGAKNNLSKSNVNLVFAVGDMIGSCEKTQECVGKFAAWKSTMGELAKKTYAMQGNHDRTGREKADDAWNQSFNFPRNGPAGFQNFTYSFDYGNSHFVVLDSDKPDENEVNSTQRQWLEADLAKNKKENTFVFFHEPAYPVNSKIDESLDVHSADRDDLWNIMVRHKVTAVFSGHEHIASRRKVNGLYQFVFGNTQSFNHLPPKPGMAEYSYVGQSYGIVTVSGKKINVKTFTTAGKELNSFDFEK